MCDHLLNIALAWIGFDAWNRAYCSCLAHAAHTNSTHSTARYLFDKLIPLTLVPVCACRRLRVYANSELKTGHWMAMSLDCACQTSLATKLSHWSAFVKAGT
jgi:hypothetical protein